MPHSWIHIRVIATCAVQGLSRQLIEKIHEITEGNYKEWYIGITNDPDRRKGEHGDPHTWRVWNVGRKIYADEIEKYFTDRYMEGGRGGSENPTHVYIYRLDSS